MGALIEHEGFEFPCLSEKCRKMTKEQKCFAIRKGIVSITWSHLDLRYFGGDIHVQSMHGFGTDVYLNVNHLGDVLESDGSERHVRLVAS